MEFEFDNVEEQYDVPVIIKVLPGPLKMTRKKLK
jgi:hypothetical protein